MIIKVMASNTSLEALTNIAMFKSAKSSLNLVQVFVETKFIAVVFSENTINTLDSSTVLL